ncbi:phytanoyl-CoA dioxygenase family protein [Chachezhania sediminis]|uniref:hypothetical protein n=1 Tax=Chachezhania sediminis TaxID=2599291 RepID=UPI00131C88CC|nr:hypothetical protein [Chachezhania sediminis]
MELLPETLRQQFLDRGWLHFPFDGHVANWAAAARPAALASVRDPAFAQWLVCEGTWFVGLDALANDKTGRVAGSPPLAGPAMEFATDLYGAMPLHPAQVSVVWPGYPRPREGEGPAAAHYRLTRDAAHVDGLRRHGPARRRFMGEPHAWILGLPLSDAASGAAPLVVWEGSHRLMRKAFHTAFEGHDPADWPDIDVTALYQQARRDAFGSCRRIELPARPGEATLLHRHVLHGVAPWRPDTPDPAGEGRMIAYFRPHLPGGVADWMTLP